MHKVVRENLQTLFAAAEQGSAGAPLPNFVRAELERLAVRSRNDIHHSNHALLDHDRRVLHHVVDPNRERPSLRQLAVGAR